MNADQLKRRTYDFGLDVLQLSRRLPDTTEARNVRGQLTRAATAVAANYRAACRARSRAEFIAKIGVCCEEADEAHMWLCLCLDAGFSTRADTTRLIDEADQLTRMFTASAITARRRSRV